MNYTETERKNHICELQQYLRTLAKVNKRLLSVTVSGVFDEETLQAVKAFQKECALPETGEVDTTAWNALVREYTRFRHNFSAPESLSPFRIPYYTVRPGERNALVSILQILLNALADQYENLPRVSQSGEMDVQTGQALRVFQQAGGLPPTGEADRNTWDLLARAFNSL